MSFACAIASALRACSAGTEALRPRTASTASRPRASRDDREIGRVHSAGIAYENGTALTQPRAELGLLLCGYSFEGHVRNLARDAR